MAAETLEKVDDGLICAYLLDGRGGGRELGWTRLAPGGRSRGSSACTSAGSAARAGAGCPRTAASIPCSAMRCCPRSGRSARQVGIDLTAFAVFSGAVGVSIGFGLHKVVANLISGVILLLDRSVKPGDVIAVGDSYGWIDSLGARYVSVVTRGGIEYLIANEDLITNRVENWSYSNNFLYLHAPIGISYGADVRESMRLCLEAARAAPRVLAQPEPVCLITGVGESSVDLELCFWINDPEAGTTNVRSAVLLGVWDRFREHGIEVPFPQRDLHIRTPAELRVLTAPADGRQRMRAPAAADS